MPKSINCSSKAIYCDICNNWLHLKCSNVSNIQFAELASSSAPYYCHACISNALPINAVTNTNDVKTDYLGLAEMKDEDIEVGCDYHDINSFNQLNTQNKNNICLLHVNIRSLRKNIEKLSMILADLQVPPQIIALSETKINKKQGVNFSTTLEGYDFLHFDSDELEFILITACHINLGMIYQLHLATLSVSGLRSAYVIKSA